MHGQSADENSENSSTQSFYQKIQVLQRKTISGFLGDTGTQPKKNLSIVLVEMTLNRVTFESANAAQHTFRVQMALNNTLAEDAENADQQRTENTAQQHTQTHFQTLKMPINNTLKTPLNNTCNTFWNAANVAQLLTQHTFSVRRRSYDVRVVKLSPSGSLSSFSQMLYIHNRYIIIDLPFMYW